ncbi:LOW QUALITY PROTEIN: hypothetical protein HID58_073423, partial [Brassica napus]
INACLKNIECVTELHEISIDDHGTRQGPYIGRHSLEQGYLQDIEEQWRRSISNDDLNVCSFEPSKKKTLTQRRIDVEVLESRSKNCKQFMGLGFYCRLPNSRLDIINL